METACRYWIIEQLFNVVTDTPSETMTGPADAEGNPTVSTDDIIRATAAELAACDYALAIIKDPVNEGSYFTGSDMTR